MQILNALSLTSIVNDWLANSRDLRILHLFDSVCNLINEDREVLSIVTPQIGNGPFNLVVESMISFSELLSLDSPIFISDRKLALGDLTIQVANANLWNPQPDWERLHDNRNYVFHPLMKLQIMDYLERSGLDTTFAVAQLYSTTAVNLKLPMTDYQLSNSLSSSLAIADLSSSLTAAKELAGSGVGLTPSGDDFIMGALYATWMIHPREIAGVLTQAIADTAAARTTSLSAAWLQAAGRGEAGILWHEFFDALLLSENMRIQRAMDKILAVGETSGADALAGFISTLTYSNSNL